MKRNIIITSLLFLSCSETPRSLFPVPAENPAAPADSRSRIRLPVPTAIRLPVP